jgi:aldose 1-epimerase
VTRGDDGRVRARVTYPDGQSVVVWGGPTTRWLVVYDAFTLTGEVFRRSIAVEPNTAPANALRSGTDLDVLAPGEELDLEWGLQPSWLS